MSPLALRGVDSLKVEEKRSGAGVNVGPFRLARLRLVLLRVKRGFSLRVLSVKDALKRSRRNCLRRQESALTSFPEASFSLLPLAKGAFFSSLLCNCRSGGDFFGEASCFFSSDRREIPPSTSRE